MFFRGIIVRTILFIFIVVLLTSIIIKATLSPQVLSWKEMRISPAEIMSIFVLTFLGGSLLSSYLIRKIIKPIREIDDSFKRASGGDFSARIDVSSCGEVESLARSFNQFMETIQMSHQELKSEYDHIKLSDRRKTAELEKEISGHTAARERIKKGEERYKSLLDSIPEIVLATDVDGNIAYSNPACATLTGFTAERLMSMKLSDIVAPECHPAIEKILLSNRDGHAPESCEVEIINSLGERLTFQLHPSPFTDYQGSLIGLLCIARDISGERKMEKQLLHLQKMRAIGTFAEGIAHDFNNILTAILGNIELAKMELSQDHPASDLIKASEEGGARAKELVKQLLHFGSPGSTKHELLSLNLMVEKTIILLRAVIPSTIEIITNLGSEPCLIAASPSMLTQIITNMSLNAKDAMPRGGKLSFETETVTADENYCRDHIEAHLGEFCVLRVADTGMGMRPEVIERIFEPFFTTKMRSSGAGLGLSIIYGHVKKMGGWIEVKSEIGLGTIFSIYLPRGEEKCDGVELELESIRGGNETILIADDEEMILSMASRILEKLGYVVLKARDATEALSIFEEKKDEINLIILDLTMPGGGGILALEEIRRITADLPVIICSGFSEKRLGEKELKEISSFVLKPFDFQSFATAVRDALDRKK